MNKRASKTAIRDSDVEEDLTRGGSRAGSCGGRRHAGGGGGGARRGGFGGGPPPIFGRVGAASAGAKQHILLVKRRGRIFFRPRFSFHPTSTAMRCIGLAP